MRAGSNPRRKTAFRMSAGCGQIMPPRQMAMADKAFGAVHLRAELHHGEADAVIPTKRNRIQHIPQDAEAYKWRHLMNNQISKIKEFSGVNTR